jgi:hypothetical protein
MKTPIIFKQKLYSLIDCNWVELIERMIITCGRAPLFIPLWNTKKDAHSKSTLPPNLDYFTRYFTMTTSNSSDKPKSELPRGLGAYGQSQLSDFRPT